MRAFGQERDISAARFHHRLVQIHCFANGNGRHARIVADSYLDKHFGHRPINWAGVFDLMASNRRRNDYIAALRATDGDDYELLLAFVQANTEDGWRPDIPLESQPVNCGHQISVQS